MIRRARKSDAAAIKAICEAELGHKTTREVVEKRIEELGGSRHYYIAVFEDEQTRCVLGFLQAEEYTLLYGGKGWDVIALAVERKKHNA